MINNDEYKCTYETENLWDWLDGPDYNGIHATPGRYYTDLTKALFAATPAQFVVISGMIQRRRNEIVVLTQELSDLQRTLAASLSERQPSA